MRTMIALLIIAPIAMAAPAPKEPVRVQWEYKVLHLEPLQSEEKSEKHLNDLGAEGWEVCSTAALITIGGKDVRYVKVILKRPKQ